MLVLQVHGLVLQPAQHVLYLEQEYQKLQEVELFLILELLLPIILVLRLHLQWMD
jgi:hypothetical protein